MNQLNDTTMIVVTICATVGAIFIAGFLCSLAYWIYDNKWRRYYRGLQNQIGIEGENLLKELKEKGRDCSEAIWMKRMLEEVADKRTLPSKDSRKNLLKILTSSQ